MPISVPVWLGVCEPGKRWQVRRKEGGASVIGQVTTVGKWAQTTGASGCHFECASDLSHQKGRGQRHWYPNLPLALPETCSQRQQLRCSWPAPVQPKRSLEMRAVGMHRRTLLAFTWMKNDEGQWEVQFCSGWCSINTCWMGACMIGQVSPMSL